MADEHRVEHRDFARSVVTTLDSLPEQVVKCIARNLDARSICRLAQVCVTLNTITQTFGEVWVQLLLHRWGRDLPIEVAREIVPVTSKSVDLAVYRAFHQQELGILAAVRVLSRKYAIMDTQQYAIDRSDLDKNLEALPFAQEVASGATSYIFESLSHSEDMTVAFYSKLLAERNASSARVARFARLAKLPDSELSAQLHVGCAGFEEMLRHYLEGVKKLGRPMLLPKSQIRDPVAEVARLGTIFADRTAGMTAPAKLDALCIFLRDEVCLRGNEEDYYNPMNSCIGHVLERKLGNPITLSIVTIAVAQHAGLTLKTVNFPRHFLLSYEGYNSDRIFLDCFHGFRRLSLNELYAENRALFTSFSNDINAYRNFLQCIDNLPVVQTLLRITRNLVSFFDPDLYDSIYARRRIADLLMEISDVAVVLDAAPESGNHDMDSNLQNIGELWRRGHIPTAVQRLRGLLEDPAALPENRVNLQRMLDRALEHLIQPDHTPRHRTIFGGESSHLSPYCGSLCRHRKYGYFCVVTIWDSRCIASETWKKQMGVYRLRNKDLQPFFHVKAHDGSSRYAALESLELYADFVLNDVLLSKSKDTRGFRLAVMTLQQQILQKHHDLGQFFTAFDSAISAFRMNSALREVFPEDEAFQVVCSDRWAKVLAERCDAEPYVAQPTPELNELLRVLHVGEYYQMGLEQ